MRDEFDERAYRIFGKAIGKINWPYGLNDPDWSVRRRNPERYAIECAEQDEARRVAVEWAERYGLRATDKACCPRWLLRNASQRCWMGNDKCTRFGGGEFIHDSDWLDHGSGWLLNGKPVAITSAPYHVRDEDQARLDMWAQDDRLKYVLGGPGWYGFTTTQVVMWRADRIAEMEPAPDAGRGAARRG